MCIHTIGGGNMSEIIRTEAGTITAPQAGISEATYLRFVSFIDVKEKSAETYTRNLRPMFRYFAENDITRPQREDIISYRESLKPKVQSIPCLELGSLSQPPRRKVIR